MSLARAAFHTMRRLPVLGAAADFIIREGRNIFWARRGVNKSQIGEVPKDFLNLLVSELQSPPTFALLEIGAGDGRVLRCLSRLYPAATFTGIDLQKAAVAFGIGQIDRDAPSRNVRLVLGSCLDPAISEPCDYLVSRTSLIYLNDAEIRAFLRLYLPKVRKKLVLQEVVSTSGMMERSHYFAHPLAALIRDIGGEAFAVTEKTLDHGPWKGVAWTGANIIATRIDRV
jgi:hypothetical protein